MGTVDTTRNFALCLGVDIVDFSMRTIPQQEYAIEELERILTNSPTYNKRSREIIAVPSGDGFFVAFFTVDEPRLPLDCAFDIAVAMAALPKTNDHDRKHFEVRMGIASGVL